MSSSALTRVVVASGYPDVCLTPLELARLRDNISREIDALPREGRAPRFDDVSLKRGAIVVQAADSWSRDWIVERAPHFRLGEGLEIKVQELQCLQRFLRATVLIQGEPEDPAVVLRRH